ncbi:MAG: hypothetical protein Kow0090_05220 [Myxococcota bacterium]
MEAVTKEEGERANRQNPAVGVESGNKQKRYKIKGDPGEGRLFFKREKDRGLRYGLLLLFTFFVLPSPQLLCQYI